MNLGPRHIPSGFQLFLMGPIHKRALPERAHIISCVDLPCNRMPALFYFSPHRCTYSKGGERNGMMRGLSQYIIYHFFLTLDHWWWLRTRWNLEEGTDRIEHHGIGKGRCPANKYDGPRPHVPCAAPTWMMLILVL